MPAFLPLVASLSRLLILQINKSLSHTDTILLKYLVTMCGSGMCCQQMVNLVRIGETEATTYRYLSRTAN